MSQQSNSDRHAFSFFDPSLWPGIDSKFRLVMIAALRHKQLIRGASPRIAQDPGSKRKSIQIALEEVRQGLVGFSIMPPEQPTVKTIPEPVEVH
jgi:DNA-directed RNA polymerase omega subunit